MNHKPEVRCQSFIDDWRTATLDEVLTRMYNGQTPLRFIPEYWNGTINWISSGELNRGTINATVEKITHAGLQSANLEIVPKGTFLMSMFGLEAPMTRGNCAILGIDSAINQAIMALFPDEKQLDSGFLFQWYSSVGNEYGLKYTQGTKQQNYKAEIIRTLPISLPELEEQRKIAIILSKLDQLIVFQQKKIDTLISVRKSMLLKMFPRNGSKGPEIRFKGFAGEWAEKRFGDLYQRVNERNDGSFGKDKWISVAKMYYQDPDKVTSNNIDTRTYVMRVGDIAFEGHSNAEFRYGRFVENDIGPGVISELFPIYRPICEYDLKYWKYAIQLEHIMGKIIASCITSSGTSSNKLVENDLIERIMLVPCIEEQKQIGLFFANMDKEIGLQRKRLEMYQKYKQGLLARMFI